MDLKSKNWHQNYMEATLERAKTLNIFSEKP